MKRWKPLTLGDHKQHTISVYEHVNKIITGQLILNWLIDYITNFMYNFIRFCVTFQKQQNSICKAEFKVNSHIPWLKILQIQMYVFYVCIVCLAVLWNINGTVSWHYAMLPCYLQACYKRDQLRFRSQLLFHAIALFVPQPWHIYIFILSLYNIRSASLLVSFCLAA